VTAFIRGYDSALRRPNCPDVWVRAGQAACVPQGQHHRFDLVGQRGGVSRWSHISFRLLGGMDVFSFLEPPTIIAGPAARRIGAINEELAGLYAAADVPVHLAVRRRALATELLAILAERSAVREDRLPAGEALQRLSDVLPLITKNLAQPPDIRAMARACALSISRFHATFRAVMGVSPGRYVQDLRLLRAKHLLFVSDLPVKAVAGETGYGDVFHFSRLFRKRCGLSPSAYRDRVRQGRM
jgi:AraC-like DNA-binding protein